jgi:hypothetical protein
LRLSERLAECELADSCGETRRERGSDPGIS